METFQYKLNSMSPNRFHCTLGFSLWLLANTIFLVLPVATVVGQTNSPLTVKKRPNQPQSKTAPQRVASTQVPGKAATAGASSKTSKQETEAPEPEKVVLETSDGVKLTTTYFKPAVAEGEGDQAKAIPFILLHDWEGNRTQLLQYAAFLQSAGHAAIVPDLRGHGDSTAVTGLKKPIDAKKFRKNEVASVLKDIERCKKYLVKRDNEGEVNIDMLSVVAVGKPSVLAVEWVMNDWFAFPPFNAKGIKQGQDVKSLILISPRKKLEGLSLVANWRNSLYSGVDGNAIPLMIIWASGDEEAAKDAESLFKQAEKSRPDPDEIDDPKKREQATTLVGVPIRRNRSTGVQLMSQPRVKGLWGYIDKFISKKMEANADALPWKSRQKDQKKKAPVALP